MRQKHAGFRVALLGYGLAGAAFHAPLIATTPRVTLAAIVTGNAERRRAAAAAHPGAELLDDPRRIWDRADEFDLAVIATPNRTHVPLALAALEAGLAVVVDKPFAPSLDGAQRVVEEARRRRIPLTVFQNRRWDGDFLTVRRILREGLLGDVLRFESRFDRWRPHRKGGWRESGAPEEAGGLLFDLGSHLIDQALQLFGPVEHVYAELDRRRPGIEADDDVFVALTHASGERSHLWASVLAAQLGPRFRVMGTRAAYVKHGLDVQEAALRAGGRPGGAEWGREPEEQWGLLGSGDDVRRIPTEQGSYHRFYDELASSLTNGKPVPVDPGDALAGLAVIEAARRSAAERRTVAPAAVPAWPAR